jgi:hypothetical protein
LIIAFTAYLVFQRNELPKGRLFIKELFMKKVLKKLLKYSAIIIVIGIILFIVSYNYTFVELTAEYSDEKFTKRRIGNLSVELPERFKLNDYQATIIIYPEFRLSLKEKLLDNLTDDSLSVERCGYRPPYGDSEDNEEKDAFEFITNPHTLHTPKVFYPTASQYSITIYLDKGCITLDSTVTDETSLEARQGIFKDRINNFLKYYSEFDENEVNDDDFLTILGIIKPNNEFKITTHFLFSDTDEKFIKPSTTMLTIDFLNHTESFPSQILADSLLSKLKYYFLCRMLYNNIFWNFRWTFSQREFKLPSYQVEERILMNAAKKDTPIDFQMRLLLRHDSTNYEFYNYTYIVLTVYPVDQQKPRNYNILYGYWLKIVQSVV